MKDILDINTDDIGAVNTDILLRNMSDIVEAKGIAPKKENSHQHQQESKTRRVQLLMRPHTVSILQAKAKQLNLSFNELLNKIAEEYIKS